MYEQTMNNDVTLTGGENPLLAGRYQVVRQLGTGGMGSVWLAEDRQLDNKLFAVKMLPSILVANKRAYRQLKDEALVAMKLVHPNIVQIRAFEENNGNPFLVMDYIEGQTLDDYLAEKGTLSEEDTVKLLKPIAAALDYAHGEGVVHRDVKPANVMIRKDGRPFVLDFGIAREIQETMTRVTGKSSSGTLMYMSPEQLNGELPKKEQDIYSFAAMVYECLKGEPPFVRGQIEYQIVNNPPPPLPQGTASWLSATTMRGLAKKANERPTTCCEILGVLSCGMIVADDIKLQTQVAIKAYRDEDYEKAFAAAQKADKDDAEIQYIMGRCYQFGDGVEEDHDVAMLWYRKAAVQGHLGALLEIGWLYREKFDGPSSEWQEKEGEELKTAFNMALKSADARVRSVFAYLYVCCNYGRGQGYGLEEQIKVDEVTALELIKESANGGYAEAQYQLGWRYEDGHSISQDYGEAVKWYRKAAEQGTQEAQEKLGEMYKKGLGVEKDYDEAIKWYRKAVESLDSVRNVYNLAQMYALAKKYSVAVKWYRKAAERGHCDAQCKLGDMCRTGCGMDRNGQEAIVWYRKAAEQDNPRAQYFLAVSLMIYNRLKWSGEPMEWLRKSAEHGYGDAQHELASIYEKGNEEAGISVDAIESARWYKRAEQSYRKEAECGDISAQYHLGLMLYEGEGVMQDFKEAVKWWSKAAARGNISSQYYLGNCFARGQGVSQDYVEAVKWYRKAAERGGAKAQCTLGGMYKNGIGVVQDYREAMAWFLKAAEQHNDEACYELGCMYQKGVGVEQDYVKAMEWYKKASSHHAAEYNLGLMYENGYGIPSDYEEARKHYTFAALYGNADAAFCCGRFYYHGLGVVQDYAKAVDWFQKADTKGSRDARYYLGLMYYNGEGVEQNDVEAVKWFLKAAEQGDAEAQYALGILCQSGRGVAKDEAEAVKWYRKAAEQGYEDAVESLKKLAGGVQLDNVSKTDGNRHETCETCALALPGGAKMEMIYVAPGSFMMGSPGDESGRFGNEIQHHVTITKGFWLGKYPVTQEEWGSVMGENPAKFKNKRSPVENVSWKDCKEFCQRLNTRLNCGARLPTEAEWEYACRAGSIGGYGVNGSTDEISWHRDNSNNKTHPVGQKGTNAWGFMDMHGNVWEWCEDWYGDYSGATQFDPKGPESGDKRVARGGSWFDPLYCGRSAMRSGYSPRVRDPAMGFRLCCTTE